MNRIPDNEPEENPTQKIAMIAATSSITLKEMAIAAAQDVHGTGYTVIEQDEKAEYPWMLFTTQSADMYHRREVGSQLWYIVRGRQRIYTYALFIKEASMPPYLIDKWGKFFKTAKIVYQ